MAIYETDRALLGLPYNYMPNGGGEHGTASWQAFNTSFTNGVPGSIALGSSKVFVSHTSGPTHVLQGNASLVFNCNDATSSSGHGLISDPMTFADADLGKIIASTFDYNFITSPENVDVSGSSTQTLEVWIYNVGLNSWYQPSGFRSINTKGLTGSLVPGRTPAITFQSDISNSSNKNQYRIALIIRNAPVGTFAMAFDNVYFGRQIAANGPVVTDWQSFTMIINSTGSTPSSGTIVNNSAAWRRVGDSMQIKWQYEQSSGGSAGSGSYLLQLPPGYAADTTLMQSDTGGQGSTVGHGFLETNNGANNTIAHVFLFNSTNLGILPSNTAALWGSGSVYDFSQANTTKYSILATVKIAGWSSNVQLSSDTDTRIVAARYSSVAGQSIPNSSSTPVNYDTQVIDTHHAVTPGASWVFTAPVSGVYRVSASVEYTPSSSGNRQIRLLKNGSNYSYLGLQSNISGSDPIIVSGTALIQLNAGNTLSVNTLQNSGGSLSLSTDGVLGNYVDIERLSGPSVIAASEFVGARYATASAQSIPNNTTATIINFDTLYYDTHGAVTTGSGWRFTAPVTGIYRVHSTLLYDTNSWPAASVANMEIWRNGAIYAVAGRHESISTATQYLDIHGTTTMALNAGDYLEVRSFQNSGGSRSLFNNIWYNYVEIEKMGNQ